MKTISHVSHLVNLWIIYFTPLYIVNLFSSSALQILLKLRMKKCKRVGTLHDRFIMQIAVQFESFLCIFQTILKPIGIVEQSMNWQIEGKS